MESAGFGASNHIPKISFLMNHEGEFINTYVGSQTIEDTITSLVICSCNVSPLVMDWKISDLYHEQGSDEVEAIFVARVMSGILTPRGGCDLVPIEKINIKDKYVRSIQQSPRF